MLRLEQAHLPSRWVEAPLANIKLWQLSGPGFDTSGILQCYIAQKLKCESLVRWGKPTGAIGIRPGGCPSAMETFGQEIRFGWPLGVNLMSNRTLCFLKWWRNSLFRWRITTRDIIVVLFFLFFFFWGACHQESLHIFGTFSVTLRCHKMPLKSWLMKNNWHEGTIVKRCITTVLTSLHIEGGAHFRLCCWSLTEVRKSNH